MGTLFMHKKAAFMYWQWMWMRHHIIRRLCFVVFEHSSISKCVLWRWDSSAIFAVLMTVLWFLMNFLWFLSISLTFLQRTHIIVIHTEREKPIYFHTERENHTFAEKMDNGVKYNSEAVTSGFMYWKWMCMKVFTASCVIYAGFLILEVRIMNLEIQNL